MLEGRAGPRPAQWGPRRVAPETQSQQESTGPRAGPGSSLLAQQLLFPADRLIPPSAPAESSMWWTPRPPSGLAGPSLGQSSLQFLRVGGDCGGPA